MEKAKRNNQPQPASAETPQVETLDEAVARRRREFEEGLKKFSGTCHTLVHRPHMGFANYAIATLELKDGKIESVSISDPYAGFEAFAKLELKNERLLEKLRNTYPPEFQHVV